METVLFSLFLILLVGSYVFLTMWEGRAKKRTKAEAYRLLDTPNPDLTQLKKTIKYLRVYGGRWRKDKECVQLVRRLQEKLELVEVAVDRLKS
jgi:hypothetical protein